MVEIIENIGDSFETALRVEGATSSVEGVPAEYEYLKERYGAAGEGWELLQQACRNHVGRSYDILYIRLRNGEERTVYFDITEFHSLAKAAKVGIIGARYVPETPKERP